MILSSLILGIFFYNYYTAVKTSSSVSVKFKASVQGFQDLIKNDITVSLSIIGFQRMFPRGKVVRIPEESVFRFPCPGSQRMSQIPEWSDS